MSTQQRRPAISRKGTHPIESLVAPAAATPEPASNPIEPPTAAAPPAPEPPAPTAVEPRSVPADTATTQLNSRISVEHRRALEEAVLVLSVKRGRRLTLREVIEEGIDGLRIANNLTPVRPVEPS